MSKYAIYRMFDGCDDAPYNVEFYGHLVGSRVWTGDDDPTALMAREHVRDGWHTVPPKDERREVAERLREYIVYAKEHDLCGDYGMGSGKVIETRCTLYNDIASCIEECGNFNLSAEEVFTRLADLIDPEGDEDDTD